MNMLEFMALKNILEQFTCSVYWKDKHGVYQGQNSYADQILKINGFSSDVVGKMDHDLFGEKLAIKFHNHDQLVMEKRSPGLFVEDVKNRDGNRIYSISSKTPLISPDNQLHGILGITYHVNQLTVAGRTEFLTKRELECLVLTYSGSTMKDAANLLKLSPRTVEAHIESVKNKLGCNTKSEVFAIVNVNGMARGYEYFAKYLRGTVTTVAV